MSTLSLRLPDSLHRKVRELAERDDISINQFIAMAVAEKMASLLTLDYLTERAARGNRAAFDAVLARVPARRPMAGDELPAERPTFTRGRATGGASRPTVRAQGWAPARRARPPGAMCC
jgi:predicted transcriptional regulator